MSKISFFGGYAPALVGIQPVKIKLHRLSIPTRRLTSAACPVELLSFLRPSLSALRCSGRGEYGANNSYPQDQSSSNNGFWRKWMMETAEMRSRVAKLGLSAVLTYGLFDAVTYTTFFVLAFLGYEKSTGKNPGANLKSLLGIIILMWTGNNITRPFRVTGAAALAPLVDIGLKKIQRYFNFSSLIYAFALVVSLIAASCLTVIGLLIISRWGN